MTHSQSNSPKHYTQLNAEERGMIDALYHTHELSYHEIAAEINRSASTVKREIDRASVRQLHSNRLPFHDYFADAAQAQHEKLRHHDYRKMHVQGRWRSFFNWLVAKVRKDHAGFREQSVDGYVHLFERVYPDIPCPSTPTVYRYIDDDLLPLDNTDLPEKLRRRVKKPGRKHDRQNKRLVGTSIEERPEAVNERKTFGDWEGDLVKGKRTVNEPALLTLTERETRYELVFKIPNYHAETCRQALQWVVDTQGADLFHSITFDNGSEFALLDQVQDTQIYYCHPYTPSERGSNENANGLLREFIPKGVSLHHFSKEFVHHMQVVLNERLRKILSYHSPAEAFRECVEKLRATAAVG